MRSRGGWGHASSRQLPPLILLLLAAAAVALGPAVGARSSSATAALFGSGAFPAADAGHVGVADDERRGPDPAPSRAALRHASPTGPVLERPTFDALLPTVALAGPLLALIAGSGGNERRRVHTLPGTSARGPPALMA